MRCGECCRAAVSCDADGCVCDLCARAPRLDMKDESQSQSDELACDESMFGVQLNKSPFFELPPLPLTCARPTSNVFWSRHAFTFTQHEPRRTHSVKSRDRRGGRAPRRVKNARVCVGVCVCRSGRRGRRSGAGLARPPVGLGSAWGTELLSSLSSDTSPPPASYDQQAHGANNDSCNNVSEHAGHQ